MIKDNHEAMFQKATSVRFTESLSKKELLQKKIEIELEQMKRNSSIFLILFKEFPLNEKTAISTMMEDFRREMMEWHKQCLQEVFGSRLTSGIWDLIIIYEGMMKEYSSLMIFRRMSIPIDKVARVIATSIEGAAIAMEKTEPVLTKNSLFFHGMEKEVSNQKEILNQLFRDIEIKLKKISLPSEEREKLMSTLSHLKEECQSNQPKLYLLEALSSYLKENEQIRNTVKEMEWIITRLYQKEGATDNV